MLVIGKRSKEEVLHGLQGRFCIEPISFEQVDRFTREDLQREAAYWKEQGRADSGGTWERADSYMEFGENAYHGYVFGPEYLIHRGRRYTCDGYEELFLRLSELLDEMLFHKEW